jgi:hypothetical protein
MSDEVINDTEVSSVSAGAEALEACEKAYADMTATEVRLGFGDCHADWRAPLAKVAIFKAAEEEAAKTTAADKATNYAYVPEGEELTPVEAKDKAGTFHDATEDKKEMLKKFYPEVYKERYPEEGSESQSEESSD